MPDYLQPTPASVPINDRPLEDIFGDAIAGITGLNRNTHVRPYLQPTPPNFPDQETNWVAFKVSPVDQDTFAFVRPTSSLEGGTGTVERDEYLDVLMSFYGANSNQYMSRWREGLSIDQNRWALQEEGIKLIGMGQPINVPSLLKDRYVRRLDITMQFARRVALVYDVRTIASAAGELITEPLPPVTLTINPPTPTP